MLAVPAPGKLCKVGSLRLTQVLDDVGQVEGLEGVGDALAVTVGAVLAGLEVDVGDEVGERVGLDDESKGRVGVGLEDLGDG